MKNNKKTLGTHLKEWLTPGLLLGAIVTGAYYGGEYKAESKEVQFSSPKEKVLTEKHMNSGYSEVANLLAAQELAKKADTLKKVYDFALYVFENDRDNTISAIESRNTRDSAYAETAKQQKKNDSVIQIIQYEQRNASRATELILKKLDSMNKQ